jgi:CysZ protein
LESATTVYSGNIASSFIQGVRYPLRAFRIIRSDRVLRRYALLPFAINLLVFGLALTAFVYWYGDLWHLIADWTNIARPESWYWLPVYWLLELVGWLLAALLVLVAILVIWFTFTLVGNILAAPFNELLSAATEQKLETSVMEASQGGWIDLYREGWRAIGDETRKLGFFVAVQAILLPLNIFPLIGNLAYMVLSLGFGVLFVALEFVDYPMARRRIPFAERRRTVWRNRAVMSGFGGSLFLSFLIPGLNLIVLPLGVVGGTLLYHELSGAPEEPPERP